MSTHPSISRLIHFLPSPSVPEQKNWPLIESQIGSTLPKDYKELVDTYGGGEFDRCIWLLEPGCANSGYDLIIAGKERAEAFEWLWETGEDKPTELEEEGSRLIPWACTENGEYLFWLVRPGQGPDAWTVMVNEGRGPEWERFAMTCADFLSSVLAGDMNSEILCELPAGVHEFHPSVEFV
ncbi:SMI1/KNR4 family protein [Streptomyces sp. H27-D2]|uniref:SMI1/KNR4 family protein n=1 Tax=Streptomyces sp. H27-D2 TaxID=3046304 RepID=UPI002DBC8FE7|nr:SMI1/KNR4 family protein [Streptomyces sp. H27-D2]MEC4016973.1 SMI1/KNR4 family protein [Streptomyces sp. H27-D2]